MILKRILTAAAVVIAVLYAGDWIWFSHQTSSPGGGLGSVTYYYASALKDGKAEVYFDQPQTEVCARSIFPHAGYNPCWYENRRSNIRTVD
jgi:hypothetical protein